MNRKKTFLSFKAEKEGSSDVEHTLDTLPCGSSAVIRRLATCGTMRRRLMDIGFTPGSPVESLFAGLADGPTAYLVHGAVIALRREDAKTIFVEPTAEPHFSAEVTGA